MEKMNNLYNQIKWAYQRVTQGYDERIMWGFDGYFIQIIPALKKFCEDELEERWDDNKERVKIFKKTLDLIGDYERTDSITQDDESLTNLAEYFGKNISWYWS